MNIPTRVSLLERIKDLEDNASWRDFFNTYWKLIYAVALKAGLSDAEAQDVVQETVIGVAKKIPQFTYQPGRDSFKGWLLQLTRWKIIAQIRKRGETEPSIAAARSEEQGLEAGTHGGPASTQDLDIVWDEEWRKHALKVALKRIKNLVPKPHYEIFIRYGIKEEPAHEVARTCGVSISQVYLVKHRVADLVREQIKRLETELV